MQATAPQGTIYRPETAVVGATLGAESALSAISWAAVIAGAFAAAAMGLILVILGTGLGLSAVSPWFHSGASATTIGVAGAIWVLVTSAFASAIGGYLAGRLRTRWTNVHTDEVFFRDTAHGFIAWSVGTVITAIVLTSAAGSLLGGAAKVAATGAAVAGVGAAGAATAAATVAGQGPAQSTVDPNAYYVDSLFRTEKPADAPAPAAPADATAATSAVAPAGAAAPADAASRAEVGRIFASGLKSGDMPPADRLYVSQLVAARTGMSPADADKRVNDAYASAKAAAADVETKAREAADAARKAAATTALWTFIALLVGAFAASYAATIGGRLRDGLHA